MDKKKLRNDIILVASLLLVAAISLVFVMVRSVKKNLVARIYVQDTVVEVVDLSETGDMDYFVHGLKGELHIHKHDGSIAVVESNCPHQDCVRMGYVSKSNHPIICAYNATYIVIEGGTVNNDVEIG